MENTTAPTAPTALIGKLRQRFGVGVVVVPAKPAAEVAGEGGTADGTAAPLKSARPEEAAAVAEPMPADLPAVEEPTPPDGAEVFVCDADGYFAPRMKGPPFMWSWAGGPCWFYVKDHPVPVKRFRP